MKQKNVVLYKTMFIIIYSNWKLIFFIFVVNSFNTKGSNKDNTIRYILLALLLFHLKNIQLMSIYFMFVNSDI